MRRFGVDPSLIDVILVSHLHGDHFGGLPFFIMDANYASCRTKPLTIAGPPGLEARVLEAMEVMFPGSSQASNTFDLRFVELPEAAATGIPPLAVTPYRVEHPSGARAYALRILLEDKILAYSGDTEWTEALFLVSRDADLFVCECTHFENASGHHLDYETLMSHRTQLGCDRIILTHMNGDMLQRIGNLDIESAEDGKTVTL